MKSHRPGTAILSRASVATLLAFNLFILACVTCLGGEQDQLLLKSVDALKNSQYQKAVGYCTDLIAADTNGAYGYYLRGYAYESLKMYNESIADLTVFVKMKTNVIEATNALNVRGIAYAGINNHEAALDDYSTAIRYNPAYAEAYVNRAMVYNRAGKYDQALTDCNMAIMLNSNLSKAYYHRARACLGKTDYVSAISNYDIAARMGPDMHDIIYYERGCVYFTVKDYKRAFEDFDKNITLCPNDALGYSARGLTLSKLGKYKEGISDCRKAVAIETNSANCYNNLAWLLAVAPQDNLRDGQKAYEYAHRACEISGWKDPYCLGTFAAACAEVGKYSDAVKWQTRSIELGVRDGDLPASKQALALYKDGKPYHERK